MPRRLFTVFFAIALLLGMGACTSMPHPEGKPMPSISFAHIKAIPLVVGAVKTHGVADPQSEAFIISPYAALEDYLHHRFAPQGFEGALHGTIEEATVKHTYAASENRMGKMLDIAGQDVYDMTITLSLEHVGEGGVSLYGKVLTVRRVLKISEHASIADRERRQLESLETMFGELDKAVVRIVTKEMKLALSGT